MIVLASEYVMRQTDIAIVGGGLAGSTAAAMLGRMGVSAVLVDPHEIYPVCAENPIQVYRMIESAKLAR
jgi:2-polyprenyl-6-methoxyphenol hydroxylase-like FAD-dependent oxidoreductase